MRRMRGLVVSSEPVYFPVVSVQTYVILASESEPSMQDISGSAASTRSTSSSLYVVSRGLVP